MDRRERLRRAYDYLRDNGLVHTQKDVAEKMGSTRPNVSNAFAGKERYLTDRFLGRFNYAFGNIFNLGWLINGTGESMLKSPCAEDAPAATIPVQETAADGDGRDALSLALEEVSKLRQMLDKVLTERANEVGRLLTLLEKKGG